MKKCWEILEIEPTTDLKTIKKAYSKKVKQYHPEDDPKMYQLIRAAYQEAKADIENNYSNQFDLVDYDLEETKADEIPNDFIDIDQRQIDLLHQQVDSLYQSENIDNVVLWEKLINDNREDVMVILDYVLELGLEKIKNEQVINCLSNALKDDKSEYPGQKSFDDYYNKLRKQAAKGYLVLDYIFAISCLLAVALSVIITVVSCFKALFFNNEQVISNLLMFTISILTMLQSSKTLTRIYDSKAKFYYQNFYLVMQVIIWTVINSYYLVISYLYFFKEISYLWILMNLAINLIMYGFMHTKRYLKEVHRFIKPPRDLTILAVPYGLMIVMLVLVGIYFMIRVYMTKNLEYYIILTAMLVALYSNTRALLLSIKDQPHYYHLKNMNALLITNGYCSICCFNLMWHYLFNPMKINYDNYLLVMSTVFLAIVCLGFYFIININRKKQYLEIFTMKDNYQAVNRMYEFLKEKTDNGKNCKELTIFELNYYLVNLLQYDIEAGLTDIFENHLDLLLNIDEALIELDLGDLAKKFKELCKCVVIEGNYQENDDLLFDYLEHFVKYRELVYRNLNDYMVKNQRYFIYEKLKY